MSALVDAVERRDVVLVRLLLRGGATSDEDAAGLAWLLDRGVDVNAHGCLHWAAALPIAVSSASRRPYPRARLTTRTVSGPGEREQRRDDAEAQQFVRLGGSCPTCAVVRS